MLGDAHDLSAILDWAEETFWEVDEEGFLLEWPFPEEVRLEVAVLLVDLCRAFDNAEMAHRKENSLTGNKGDVKVSL